MKLDLVVLASVFVWMFFLAVFIEGAYEYLKTLWPQAVIDLEKSKGPKFDRIMVLGLTILVCVALGPLGNIFYLLNIPLDPTGGFQKFLLDLSGILLTAFTIARGSQPIHDKWVQINTVGHAFKLVGYIDAERGKEEEPDINIGI